MPVTINHMPKIKLTKGELKRQRDALFQFRRYLPTLQLKKQQLQIEILHQSVVLEEKRKQEADKRRTVGIWSGLLNEHYVDMHAWLGERRCISGIRNIAGVDMPIFEAMELEVPDYDLFRVPLWIDSALEQFKALISLREEICLIEKGIEILRQELRITAQRVNLFEKVKIPEAEEAIRLIKIYIGDQMANAVGRSKMAKRKINEAAIYGALAC